MAHEGAPLVLDWQLAEDPSVHVRVISPDPLLKAQKRALDASYLRDQLGRLGNTSYELADLTLEVSGEPFAPSSLLNQLRREATDALAAMQSAPRAMRVDSAEAARKRVADCELRIAGGEERGAAPVTTPQVHLLVRTPEQLEAAIDVRPASITLDYLELYGLRPAVERVQEAGIEARVASPRILKPQEQRVVNFLLRLDCPILVRSAGLLHALKEHDDHPTLHGDFSLNAANVLTAQTFLGLGIERLTPTYDLNAAQVAQLATAVGPQNFEVVAYQHLPVFHTEHCVFCRFLSTGTSYKDCGHPCETHKVALRDHNGREHPVLADVGCRNTVFGAEAQDASPHLDAWRAAGIVHYRLEFVHERAEQVTQITRLFAQTFQGRMDSAELTRRLSQIAPQGVTEGSLFVPAGFMEIPLMG
jgi:putative protease